MVMLSRRKLLIGAGASLLARKASALGGGGTPDPYTLPRLPGEVEGYNAFGGRTQVAVSSLSGSVGCILFGGDSVCSDVVNSLYTPTQANNFNFDIRNGALYKTVEPLLGCNWNAETPNNPSGSFFSRVADTLIANGVYANVVLVPFGLGGSLLADYASGGALAGIFAPIKARLDAAGLSATGIYYMCGANDTPAGTSQASCTTSLNSTISILRGIWSTTPIFIPEHSIFNLTASANVQNAQAAVLNSGNFIYTGGNMDSITSSSDYWDNTHPNATGAAAMASIAVTAISAHP